MILDKLLEPRNEVITTSAGLEQFLRGAGLDTWSGESVNAEKAFGLVTVYACVKIIAEGIAKLPLQVFERSGDRREKTLAISGVGADIYEILHFEPNEWQTSFEFREMMVGHAVLRGNAYAFINRVRGKVVELLPIHPDRVEPKQLPDWSIEYKITNADGTIETKPRTDIWHLRGMGSNGVVGYSPVQIHRQQLGESIALQRHSAQTFGNGAKPGGMLSHPGNLSTEAADRLQKQIDAKVGRENSGKTLILEEDMKWIQVGLSHVDAQYIESRKFSRSEIATIFGVKPHLVGDLDRAIQSNIEEQSRGHVTDTLLPWIVRIEQGLRRDLLKEISPDLFAKLIVEGLLRGSTKDQALWFDKMITLGIMTRNEVRSLLDMNPLEGLDEPLTPMNMGANNDGEDDEEEPAEDGDE